MEIGSEKEPRAYKNGDWNENYGIENGDGGEHRWYPLPRTDLAQSGYSNDFTTFLCSAFHCIAELTEYVWGCLGEDITLELLSSLFIGVRC